MQFLYWVLYWVGVMVLAFEMPVPVYWLVLHGLLEFWRKHVRAAYPVAILTAWGGGGWLLYHFRGMLFSRPTLIGDAWHTGAMVAGVALITLDFLLLIKVEHLLGGRRLAGQAELTGSTELATSGLYGHVRHPRYLGTMAGVLGGCLLVGTPHLWAVAALWWISALGMIHLEERELRRRFGPAYAAYAKRVPALLPFRLWFRQG